MLTIHLGQDENDCLSAWVSARETGLAPNDAIDQKVWIHLLWENFLNICFWSFSFKYLAAQENEWINQNLILQVNYGGLLLQALLEYWPRPYAVEEESDVDAGVSAYS